MQPPHLLLASISATPLLLMGLWAGLPSQANTERSLEAGSALLAAPPTPNNRIWVRVVDPITLTGLASALNSPPRDLSRLNSVNLSHRFEPGDWVVMDAAGADRVVEVMALDSAQIRRTPPAKQAPADPGPLPPVPVTVPDRWFDSLERIRGRLERRQAPMQAVPGQGLDQRYWQQQLRYRQQQLDRERVLAICKKQYEAAKYWSIDKDNNLRYMITPQGVQGILPDVVQQSSGKYKCQRGNTKPTVIGKTYKGDCHMIMYKIENCNSNIEGRCLVKYSQYGQGIIERNIVASDAKMPPPGSIKSRYGSSKASPVCTSPTALCF